MDKCIDVKNANFKIKNIKKYAFRECSKNRKRRDKTYWSMYIP